MKEDLENELYELSPWLANVKKQQSKEPFRTPKFYFDTLADKVLKEAKVGDIKKAPPQYFTVFSRVNTLFSSFFTPRIRVYMASFAIVTVAVWGIMQREKQPLTDNITVSTPMATEDIQQYISANLDDFDEAILLDNSTDIADIFETQPMIKSPQSGFTEQELEQYINESINNIDLDTLNDNL